MSALITIPSFFIAFILFLVGGTVARFQARLYAFAHGNASAGTLQLLLGEQVAFAVFAVEVDEDDEDDVAGTTSGTTAVAVAIAPVVVVVAH